MVTLLDYELVFINLVDPFPVLFVKIMILADADPRARVTSTVFKNESGAALLIFDFCVLLAQICRLYVHRQINLFWVPRSEKLPIRRRIDIEELSTEDAISALEQILWRPRIIYWGGQQMMLLGFFYHLYYL